MPRKNSISWSVGNSLTATRMNAINSDFDDLYASGSDRLRIYQLTGDGLLVRIGAGVWRVGNSEGIYAGGTVTVANNTTTYIMIDSGGTIQTSTSGWNGQYTRLGRAVASGGTCTIILDKNDAVGGDFGGNPTGAILLWSTNSSPTGYLLCDGSAVSRSTYAGLFATIGTSYGVGDGSTTFNLPNLGGRIPVGKNTATSKGNPTITIATPGVVTLTSHGLANGQKVYFTTTGALPTGLSVNTNYFIINADTNTFQLSTTLGGTAINTSGTQSGTHTLFSSDFSTLGGTGGEVNHKLTKNEMPNHTHDFPVYNGGGGSYATQFSYSGLYISNVNANAAGGDKEHLNVQPYIVLNYIIKT